MAAGSVPAGLVLAAQRLPARFAVDAGRSVGRNRAHQTVWVQIQDFEKREVGSVLTLSHSCQSKRSQKLLLVPLRSFLTRRVRADPSACRAHV